MIYIGTSGSQYGHWRHVLYAKGLAASRWLPYYAERFQVVEVNSTFYRLPKRSTFEDWARRSPDDFIFGLKVSRYLTQLKRLKDPEDPVRRFLDAAEGLGDKLGPLLLQLPPNFKAQPERLRDTLACFPRGTRVAVEFRDDSWHTDAIREVLAGAGAALCLADRSGKLVTPDWRTADRGYVRFHWGGHGSCYSRADLQGWAERIARTWKPSEDVYVFFNNDPEGCALRDARALALILHDLGRKTTRVPSAEDLGEA